MADFLDVYVAATGQKVRVPAGWMDHPVLSHGLRKTPVTKAAEKTNAAEADKKGTN